MHPAVLSSGAACAYTRAFLPSRPAKAVSRFPFPPPLSQFPFPQPLLFCSHRASNTQASLKFHPKKRRKMRGPTELGRRNKRPGAPGGRRRAFGGLFPRSLAEILVGLAGREHGGRGGPTALAAPPPPTCLTCCVHWASYRPGSIYWNTGYVVQRAERARRGRNFPQCPQSLWFSKPKELLTPPWKLGPGWTSRQGTRYKAQTDQERAVAP
jgi:hypothetical protein